MLSMVATWTKASGKMLNSAPGGSNMDKGEWDDS